METAASIRSFWFGEEFDDAASARAQAALWWSKDAQMDALIRQRFAESSELAAQGALDAWRTTAVGSLSLILLCDQFPRNMYRNTGQAFSLDAVARKIASEAIAAGQDDELRLIERVFMYLPFEHSESIEDQERALALFEDLARQAPIAHQQIFEGFLNFARRHYEVILRFQRFPHRNLILGRASSPDELEFLSQPGSSF